MKKRQMSGPDRTKQVSPVAAVIVPCTSRKSRPATIDARAVSLPSLPQNELETAWSGRVRGLKAVVAARDLYTGRGAHLGRRAAHAVGADLYFASAGLGLVHADAIVPSYGITVADRGDDAIACRVSGRFDPSSWWTAVAGGPFASDPATVLHCSRGYVLLALTRPYAAMLVGVLGRLSASQTARLRIFGWRLQDVLAPSLHVSAMPYDTRLDAILPGTQTDYAQRALVHFVESVLPGRDGDAATHGAAVSRAFEGVEAPARPVRRRLDDDGILAWIGERPSGEGIQQQLHLIRGEGFACEQARFTRLHHGARQRQGAR